MDEDYDYDDLDWASCQADDEMTPLDQLKLYQFANRNIMPLLDVYEIAVLNQIIDRTIGWKKQKAIFGGDKMYKGDTVYGGLERNMHRSRMMAALKRLEDCGLISRQTLSNGFKAKAYGVNFDIDLEQLKRVAPPKRKAYVRGAPITTPHDAVIEPTEIENLMVSNGDHLVSYTDGQVSNKDYGLPITDPREEYYENSININNIRRTARAVPAEQLTRDESKISNRIATGEISSDEQINPPPRNRRSPRTPQS